ncbi:MAG TPA: Wzz/FepE/Etk N-terminal domain-containing protein [Terriglobales bacterium]|jgi:uncharacterized protein involved in exopolysaccharide biosynthesis
MQNALLQHGIPARAKPGTSLRAAVEALFRHKKIFMICVGTIGLLVAAFLIFIPREYSSEMKILVQNGRENVVVSAEATSPVNVVSDVTESQVNSELEILQSRDVLEPVADPAWRNTPEEQRNVAELEQHEAAVRKFAKKLDTGVIRKTNIITVSFRARSPEQARNSLQALSEAYLAQHKKMQRPLGTTSFFTSQAEHYRQLWGDASVKLTEFRDKHELHSLPIREADLEQQITTTQASLLVADSTLHEQDARLAEGSRTLKAMPMRQITEDRALPNLPSVQEINTLLVEMENKRTALLANYKADDRRVTDLDRQIASTQAALNHATENRSHEVATNIDPVRQQVRTEYAETHIARRATAAYKAVLLGQVSTLQKELEGLQDLSVEYDNLDEEVQQAKGNYELYVQKRDQAQIEDAMDNQKLTNVAIAQQPTLSSITVRPRPLLDGALGIFTAFFLGLCVVYCAETGRGTIATPRELDMVTRYPLLATVSAGLIQSPLGPQVQTVEAGRKERTMIIHTTRPLTLES